MDSLLDINPLIFNIHPKILWIMLAIALVIFIAFYVMSGYKSSASASTPQNVLVTQDKQILAFKEKFAKLAQQDRKTIVNSLGGANGLTEKENCLMNFQPLTVIQPGYLGPETNGVFSVKDGVATAIQMGARCLILPIDYYSTKIAEPFDRPNTPCFLYRDEGQNIRSINPGSLREASETIASLAWSNMSFQKNDPLILILYFINTPEVNTKEYVLFLSAVAKDLAPLSGYFISQTPSGNYFRQQSQEALLFEPVKTFEKKCLIFCNVDTSIFANHQTLKNFKLQPFSIQEDLDYMVNLRLFKQNPDTMLGSTEQEISTVRSRSILEKVNYFATLPEDGRTRTNTTTLTKEKWVIALSPNGTVPSKAMAEKMLNTYGVQSVALPLFTSDDTLISLLDLWKTTWRVKPKDIRYIKPDLIVPNKQNPAVNANGGALVTPS